MQLDKQSIKILDTNKSNIQDFNQVSEKYQNAILKSSYINIFESNKINPKSKLIMSDFIKILDIIIKDSAY